MKNRIGVLFLAFFLGILCSGQSVLAAGLTLSYDEQDVSYEGKQLKVVSQKKNVELGDTPGLIIDNHTMIPYKQAFSVAALGVKNTYDAQTKSITLTHEKNTVVLTIDSTTALVNGKEVAIKVAPKIVSYLDAGTKKVLIPAKFTAENLGLEYVYNSSTATVNLTSEEANVVASSTGRAISYSGKVINYAKKEVKLNINGKEVKSVMPGLIINNVSMLPANKTFTSLDVDYVYTPKTKSVTLSNFHASIKFTLGSNYAYVNNKKVRLTQPALLIKDIKTDKNYVMVPGQFTAVQLGYEYSWDNDSATSTIIDLEVDGGEGNTGDGGTTVTPPSDDSIPNDAIKIVKPKSVSLATYKTNDDYHNKQFIITLPGDHVNFFKQNPVDNSLKKASSIAVKLNSQGNTNITFKTTAIRGFKVTETETGIYVEIKTPKQTYKRIVVIDAGHGGGDPGALGNGLYEKNLTLDIVKYAKTYFDNDPDVKVYYTRLTDSQAGITKGASGIASTTVSAQKRAVFANNIGADLFVSVHINSATATARGTEILYSSKNKIANASGLNSKKFAQIGLPELYDAVGSSKRGVKDMPNLIVCRDSKMPAILLETAFLSNKADVAILKDETKKDLMGLALYNMVSEAFDTYPTKR